MRQFILVSTLIFTIALTAATWLMPEPYQTTETPDIPKKEKLTEFQNLELITNNQNDHPVFQQFLVQNTEKETKAKPIIVTIKEPTIKITPPAPQMPVVTPPNFQYFGQMIDSGGMKKIFLSNEDESYVVKTGHILNNRWKIDSIQNDQIMILDLTNQQFFILYI